jgi:hypothetical protein
MAKWKRGVPEGYLEPEGSAVTGKTGKPWAADQGF